MSLSAEAVAQWADLADLEGLLQQGILRYLLKQALLKTKI